MLELTGLRDKALLRIKRGFEPRRRQVGETGTVAAQNSLLPDGQNIDGRNRDQPGAIRGRFGLPPADGGQVTQRISKRSRVVLASTIEPRGMVIGFRVNGFVEKTGCNVRRYGALPRFRRIAEDLLHEKTGESFAHDGFLETAAIAGICVARAVMNLMGDLPA